MAGEDTTSSVLEAPPLAPLAASALTAAFLKETADRIINATWDAGL